VKRSAGFRWSGKVSGNDPHVNRVWTTEEKWEPENGMTGINPNRLNYKSVQMDNSLHWSAATLI